MLSSLLVVGCAPVFAQDRVAVAPSSYKVEVENTWVRVLRLTLKPHEKAPRTSHPPEVVVRLAPDTGHVTFRPASSGADENVLAEPIEEIIIELRPEAARSTPVALDPVAIDPRYHTVLFENEYVRAIRTVLEPGIKSPLHEHPHYVVVYLTDLHTTMTLGDGRAVDNPRHKGDVGWRDYMKHQTLNIGKETAVEIQVELK